LTLLAKLLSQNACCGASQ